MTKFRKKINECLEDFFDILLENELVLWPSETRDRILREKRVLLESLETPLEEESLFTLKIAEVPTENDGELVSYHLEYSQKEGYSFYRFFCSDSPNCLIDDMYLEYAVEFMPGVAELAFHIYEMRKLVSWLKKDIHAMNFNYLAIDFESYAHIQSSQAYRKNWDGKYILTKF